MRDSNRCSSFCTFGGGNTEESGQNDYMVTEGGRQLEKEGGFYIYKA